MRLNKEAWYLYMMLDSALEPRPGKLCYEANNGKSLKLNIEKYFINVILYYSYLRECPCS